LFAPRGEIIPSPVITTPEENVHTHSLHVARCLLSGDLNRAQLVKLKVLKGPFQPALKFPCAHMRAKKRSLELNIVVKQELKRSYAAGLFRGSSVLSTAYFQHSVLFNNYAVLEKQLATT
jgi:hypothetical protein